MSETRTRIATHIRAKPGVHFSGLVRDLDLAPGQVQYHLRRLRSDGGIVAEDLVGQTHYYTDDYDQWEREAIALLRRERTREIILTLLDAGPRTPATVADRLGIARSTLAHHVDNLVAHDLVAKRRDDGGRVTLAATRPEATARLLREVDPSPSDRMVDRFTQLLDDLLAE